jgi:hypothetical protein
MPHGIKHGLTAHAYAQQAGKLFLFRACALCRKSSDLLEGKARKQPVVSSHTASESDVFDISVPSEYAIDDLPLPVSYESPFATYKSELRASEHVLHHARTYELRDVRVPVERMEDLKDPFSPDCRRREGIHDPETFIFNIFVEFPLTPGLFLPRSQTGIPLARLATVSGSIRALYPATVPIHPFTRGWGIE